jgi:hypothetical protein
MNRLQAELQRLYPAGPDGGVRAMVLELARPASWEALSAAWRGVQLDLELPAPAIAVSGSDGYQLWFSLSEAVPAAQASAFLEALRRRYLADIAPERIATHSRVLPPVEAAPGRWSAFVAPDLAAVFEDEPWLDLPPGADAQSDLLSGLQCTKPGDFKRALERLTPVPIGPAVEARVATVGDPEPRRFLLGVMNDPAIDLHLRIEAAKALLPYSGPNP